LYRFCTADQKQNTGFWAKFGSALLSEQFTKNGEFMLRIYTRHDKDCAHQSDMNHRRCRCPKWVRGVLPNRGAIRQSAGTRSWEEAERYARDVEQRDSKTKEPSTDNTVMKESTPAAYDGSDNNGDETETKSKAVRIREAIQLFRTDQAARGLSETTTKYRGLLQKRFAEWSEAEGFKYLQVLAPSHLTKFRSTWSASGNAGSTIFRKHEMMTTFFDFCVTQEYLRKNPMKVLKKPKMPEVVPTDYFRPKEFAQIVAATYQYKCKGKDSHIRGTVLRAFTLLMRWSGLAILDTVKLERNRLSQSPEGDDQIFLYRSKTKVPVYVVIPPELAGLLRKLPNTNPKYFFWSGNGKPTTAKRAYFRSLQKLFKLADIRDEDGAPKRCHPHMFRDTFAVELLLAGTPIDQVSLLLGHSSVKITERHYAHFCKARQLQLTSAVKKVWSGPQHVTGFGPNAGNGSSSLQLNAQLGTD
jgi:integrase